MAARTPHSAVAALAAPLADQADTVSPMFKSSSGLSLRRGWINHRLGDRWRGIGLGEFYRRLWLDISKSSLAPIVDFVRTGRFFRRVKADDRYRASTTSKSTTMNDRLAILERPFRASAAMVLVCHDCSMWNSARRGAPDWGNRIGL
jgi:hypothetical protein